MNWKQESPQQTPVHIFLSFVHFCTTHREAHRCRPYVCPCVGNTLKECMQHAISSLLLVPPAIQHNGLVDTRTCTLVHVIVLVPSSPPRRVHVTWLCLAGTSLLLAQLWGPVREYTGDDATCSIDHVRLDFAEVADCYSFCSVGM
jgi:hypothetical protein